MAALQRSAPARALAKTSLPSGCRAYLHRSSPGAAISCLSAHGYRGFIAYRPASRYWAPQGIETGILVLLAVVLIVVTAVVVLSGGG
jgi:hypothetical protein